MMHSHGKSKWHGSGCHENGNNEDGTSRSRGKGRSGFHHGHPHGKILGTTVVGERGQVVIPREARDEVGIESGDRFVVFGDKNKDCIMLVKADVFNHFAEVFMTKSKKLEKMAQEIWDATQADTPEDELESEFEDELEDALEDELEDALEEIATTGAADAAPKKAAAGTEVTSDQGESTP